MQQDIPGTLLLLTTPICREFRSRNYLRLTVSQNVLVSSTLVGRTTRCYFLSECCCLKFAVLFLRGALSDERTGLQFAVQSLNGPSRAEPITILYCVIWDSGPGSRIYIPQEQGRPVIPPGTGFQRIPSHLEERTNYGSRKENQQRKRKLNETSIRYISGRKHGLSCVSGFNTFKWRRMKWSQ
jgi:hypothetical protein